MARPIIFSKALIAANAAVIAASQTPVSGTPLALVGGGTVTLDSSRRVLLTYGNEAVARTLVLTGTDSTGNVISETLAVPSGGAPGTIASLQDFLTITQAMPAGGGWTAAVTLGTNATGSSPWMVFNNHITPFDVGVQCVLLSGTATWSIEVTRDRVLSDMPIYRAGMVNTPAVPAAFGASGLTGLAANTTGAISSVVLAGRLTITAGQGTVEVAFDQAGITN